MLTMSLLAVPALVFASFGALGALARWGFFVTGFGFLGHVARFQHRGGVVASLIFATLCLGSQLDVVQAIWAEQFAGSKTVFHYLCVR